MSLLETIACNSQTELTDWLGGKIGELLGTHAIEMIESLPFAEEIPLHTFLSRGLATAILEDVNKSVDFQLKDEIGMIAFPLNGMTMYPDNMLDELVQLARA